MKSPNKTNKAVFAFGADGKARTAFLKNRDIKWGEDLGGLNEAANLEKYEVAARRIIDKERPGILACDFHPEYNSSKLARKFNHKLSLVQHHHAHVASCIVDNNITGNVIGVAFDGTGFGTDGNIWGGEFFVVRNKNFKRAAHLDYTPMPGGEMAVREPWRMALAYLYKYYGDKLFNLKIPFVKSIDKSKALILIEMMKKNLNCPKTSSMGRLFDASAALINLTNRAGYEGEAAIKLELSAKISEEKDASYYKIKTTKRDGMIIISQEGLIKGIVDDLARGIDNTTLALKFHESLARMILDVTKKLSRGYNVKKAALSGGVFQNRLLMDKTKRLFNNSGIKLFTHENIPTSDAGISAGQAFIASRPVRNKRSLRISISNRARSV